MEACFDFKAQRGTKKNFAVSVLAQIIEDEEDEIETPSISLTPARDYLSPSKRSIAPSIDDEETSIFGPNIRILDPLLNDPKTKQLAGFVAKLRDHPELYEYFVQQAHARKVMRSPKLTSNEYYYDYMKIRPHTKIRKRSIIRDSLSPEQLKQQSRTFDYSSRHHNRYSSLDTGPTSGTLNLNALNAFINQENSRYDQRKIMERANESGSDQHSVAPSNMSAMSRMSRIFGKQKKWTRTTKKLLKSSDTQLQNTYKTVSGYNSRNIKAKMTVSTLKKYMLKRWHPKVVERMTQKLRLDGRGDYKDYKKMLNGIISANHDRQVQFAFDVYDLNDDKYIDNSDAFEALKIIDPKHSKSDIACIQEMQYQKKNKTMPTGRRGGILNTRNEQRLGTSQSRRSISASVAGSAASEQESPAVKQAYVVQRFHETNQEAITMADFRLIKFQRGKPQIFVDFVLYMTGRDFYDLYQIKSKIPGTIRRKRSEETIRQSMLSAERMEQMKEFSNAKYLESLHKVMQDYPLDQCDMLLAKFALLQDYSVNEMAIITEQSMMANFEQCFGAKCDFLAARVYHVLTGPKRLTLDKIRWLQQMSILIEGNDLDMRQWHFALFDSNLDGLVKVNEVSDMLQSMPQYTAAYAECMKIAEIFIACHINKYAEKIEELTTMSLGMAVPESLIMHEIRLSLIHADKNLNPTFNSVIRSTTTSRRTNKRNSQILNSMTSSMINLNN